MLDFSQLKPSSPYYCNHFSSFKRNIFRPFESLNASKVEMFQVSRARWRVSSYQEMSATIYDNCNYYVVVYVPDQHRFYLNNID